MNIYKPANVTVDPPGRTLLCPGFWPSAGWDWRWECCVSSISELDIDPEQITFALNSNNFSLITLHNQYCYKKHKTRL